MMKLSSERQFSCDIEVFGVIGESRVTWLNSPQLGTCWCKWGMAHINDGPYPFTITCRGSDNLNWPDYA